MSGLLKCNVRVMKSQKRLLKNLEPSAAETKYPHLASMSPFLLKIIGHFRNWFIEGIYHIYIICIIIYPYVRSKISRDIFHGHFPTSERSAGLRRCRALGVLRAADGVVILGGVHSRGGSPIAGWFWMENPRKKTRMIWGYPLDFGNVHIWNMYSLI